MSPIFSSREAYEKFALDGVLKLTKIMAAVLLWMTALTVLVLVLVGLWLAGVTGTEAAEALH